MASPQPDKSTPMMRQFQEFRERLDADTLLLFRLGDFYEMFDADAQAAAQLLGLTLTQRHGQPMAGIPHHAAAGYIRKLLQAGRKVAIADQTEVPRPGQLVKRALTRILTPGTVLEDFTLEADRNHYLLAVDWDGQRLLAAWLDLSTGEFCLSAQVEPERLLPLFTGLDPREVLIPDDRAADWEHDPRWRAFRPGWERFLDGRPLSKWPDFHFDAEPGQARVLETLGVHTLDGFGIARAHPALGVAAAVLSYAEEGLCARPRNLSRLREHTGERVLLVDPATQRNLEIFRGADGTRKGSLLSLLDTARTAAGSRLTEAWLAAPSHDLAEIERRQAAVAAFHARPDVTAEVREHLKGVRDLTRSLGRLRNGLLNPRDLGAIRETLRALPPLRDALAPVAVGDLQPLIARLRDFPQERDLLDRALREELPATLDAGGTIADGHDADLDRLRHLRENSHAWMRDFEMREAERTGIRKLRVKYTGAFGYHIEVTRANLHLVPDDYIRRQTMVNAERFVTPELKEKEREILSADERALERERELVSTLVAAIVGQAQALEDLAAALAEIDVLAGWAVLARERRYVRPAIDESDVLEIVAGRHPVVEENLQQRRLGGEAVDFVPNDTFLEATSEQIALITGPNMAGKSTYIRQVALLTLMAQIGCWVPADRFHLGLVDRIFSRVGASDDLARGNSTFMVEMTETAYILHHATAKSLVILDEIGRGTSTYDGLSIAWAVVEHLHGDGPAGPRTLFATHYHELTKIEQHLPRMRNYSVRVQELEDRIIFIRRVLPGAADKSYGVHVAKLAGLPPTVIDRAQELLVAWEGGNADSYGRASRRPPTKGATAQLEFF